MANPTLIPTYDIKNCGPRQQFWANGLIVHNCDGINLQNLPRGSKHRLALSTPPGYKCYVSDLSAIECVTGDGLVLTDKGEIPLKDVTTDHLLWDGVEWVKHKGVINKGIKEVITYDGITGTPNHVVYLESGEKTSLRDCAARKEKILIGAVRGRAVRQVDGSRYTYTVNDESGKSSLSLRLWNRELGGTSRPEIRQIDPVQPLLKAPTVSIPNTGNDTATSQTGGRHSTKVDTGWNDSRASDQTGTRTEEVYDVVNAGPRHRFCYNGRIISNCRMGAWRAGQWDLVEDFRNGVDIYSNFSSEVVFHYPVSKETKTERMVGKVCILGLGYGMGWKTFQRTLQSGPMGADPIPCTDEFARKCVQGYRERYPMIAQGWKVAEAMIVQMTDPNCNIEWGPLRVLHNCIRIPNGLFLSYPGLRQYVVEHAEGVDVGYEYWNGKFWKKIYGGLLVENITQCLAGLVIKQSMNDVDQWLQQHGLGQVVLQVHDEIIIVAKDNDPRFSPDDIQAKIQELMRVTPDWCKGLPLDCEGGYADEYSK